MLFGRVCLQHALTWLWFSLFEPSSSDACCTRPLHARLLSGRFVFPPSINIHGSKVRALVPFWWQVRFRVIIFCGGLLNLNGISLGYISQHFRILLPILKPWTGHPQNQEINHAFVLGLEVVLQRHRTTMQPTTTLQSMTSSSISHSSKTGVRLI